jgi:ATP-dependent Clp protease adaptor protein ClpS
LYNPFEGLDMSQADATTKIKINESIKEPGMFKVIYLNDNHTTMEFVVESLVEFFDYSTSTAIKITEDIHDAGQAIVAILPFEIAEQKGSEVTVCARSQNYPLQIKLEPEGI